MKRILEPMLRYQAWANSALLQVLATGADEGVAAGLSFMRHVQKMEEVFARRLAQVRQFPLPTELAEQPDGNAADVAARLAVLDSWFLSYLDQAEEAELTQPVAFTFLDGDKGFMSPGEILAHLLLHGGYHRGEAGQVLVAGGGQPPWDTVAVFLHANEPARRAQGAEHPG